MPALPTSSAADRRCILLVEEYDALAAAITAALRKFAPDYATDVSRSLADAEGRAAAAAPDLLVVDFDPPHPAALEFFSRMQIIAPHARVLIIAPEIPREVWEARKHRCAFQFIEKPFELDTLGQAVTTLTTATPSTSELPSLGTLRDLNLADVIPLQALSRENMVLTVEDGKRRGEVFFARGRMIHAVRGRTVGTDALDEMVTWARPRFALRPLPDDAPRLIEQPWHSMLLEVLRAMPVPEEPVEPTPIPKLKPTVVVPSPYTGPKRKIVVVDDTETLRVFVEEMLQSADAGLQIELAADAADGLRRVAATKPDLVLLDYSLPDLNGDGVCRLLLADEATARIPIVMMSGHVPEMTAAAERYENIVATLPKPFLSSALIELVAQTLDNPPKFKPRAAPAPTPSPAPPPPKPEPVASPRHEHKGNGHSEPVAAPPSATDKPAETPPAAPSPVIVAAPSRRSVTPTALRETSLPLEPARIVSARNNGVLIGIPLEVISMQFSSALRIAALRGRPSARTISVHIEPSATPSHPLPEASFEISRLKVDARGRIEMVRLAPRPAAPSHHDSRHRIPISAVSLLAHNGSGAMELQAANAEPMNIQLLAAFELLGVELSSSFTLSALVLRARTAPFRITLQSGGDSSGVAFGSAQAVLDERGQLAEVLLDAPMDGAKTVSGR